MQNSGEQRRQEGVDDAEVKNSQGSVVPFRVPEFMDDDVSLWFIVLESSFENSGIHSDKARYNLTVTSLSPKVLRQVKDVLTSPPHQNRYKHLKEQVIKRLVESNAARVQKLMSMQTIGDRKRSQFFRDLKDLATEQTTYKFILNMLPPSIRQDLESANLKEVQDILELADEFFASSPQTHYFRR